MWNSRAFVIVAVAIQWLPVCTFAGDRELTEQITEQIAKHLQTSGQLSDYSIGIDVRDGAAKVSGYVASQEQMDRVIQLVKEVPGVRRVVNKLEIASQSSSTLRDPPASTAEKTGQIPFVLPSRITVLSDTEAIAHVILRTMAVALGGILLVCLVGGPWILALTQKFRHLFWSIPAVGLLLFGTALCVRPYPGGFRAQFCTPGLFYTAIELGLVVLLSVGAAAILSIVCLLVRRVKRAFAPGDIVGQDRRDCMDVLEPKPTSPLPRRRWLQYSLRTMLVLTMVLAIGMSWFAVKLNQARRQQQAVETIWEHDGGVKLEGGQLLPGDGSGGTVVAANLSRYCYPSANIEDSQLICLEELTSLQELRFDKTQVTDAGLKHLKGLTELQHLSVQGTRVTDAGLEHLKGLINLQELRLDETQVTDAGLKHLKGLTNLDNLGIGGTGVTDAGLEHLKGLTNIRALNLEGTRVTDAGLEHLKALTYLEFLWLNGTQISDAGLEHLKGLTGLIGLWLDNTRVTDSGLEQLKGHSWLRFLYLGGTKVTDDGVKRLQAALPDCKIDRQPSAADERQSPAAPELSR